MRLRDVGPDAGPVALVLPGERYTCDGPLLRFATLVLTGRGWHVRQVWWDDEPPRDPAQVAAVVDALPQPPALLVGKSLGTLALPLAARRGLSGLWFTPLLHDEGVRAGVPALPAASLLVGGTADRHWDGAAARAGAGEVLEVPGGDHSLEVKTDAEASLRILGDVVAAVSGFVGRLPGA